MDRPKRGLRHSPDGSKDLSSDEGGGRAPVFTWPLRVYYEDTDLGGVVYHANYLRYFERARTEWLRSLGFEQDVLRHHHQVQFVVVEAKVKYLRPARFNDELQVSAEVHEKGRASLVFRQEIRLAGGAHTLVCSAEVRVACIDSVSLKPAALPREILKELDA